MRPNPLGVYCQPPKSIQVTSTWPQCSTWRSLPTRSPLPSPLSVLSWSPVPTGPRYGGTNTSTGQSILVHAHHLPLVCGAYGHCVGALMGWEAALVPQLARGTRCGAHGAVHRTQSPNRGQWLPPPFGPLEEPFVHHRSSWSASGRTFPHRRTEVRTRHCKGNVGRICCLPSAVANHGPAMPNACRQSAFGAQQPSGPAFPPPGATWKLACIWNPQGVLPRRSISQLLPHTPRSCVNREQMSWTCTWASTGRPLWPAHTCTCTSSVGSPRWACGPAIQSSTGQPLPCPCWPAFIPILCPASPSPARPAPGGPAPRKRGASLRVGLGGGTMGSVGAVDLGRGVTGCVWVDVCRIVGFVGAVLGIRRGHPGFPLIRTQTFSNTFEHFWMSATSVI